MTTIPPLDDAHERDRAELRSLRDDHDDGSRVNLGGVAYDDADVPSRGDVGVER